jgi:phage shock protein C
MITHSSDQARQLHRPKSGRFLGGVSGAIAQGFGIDVMTVRIAFAVLAVLGGAGAPLYAVGWMLIPDQDTDVSIFEKIMKDLRRH